jgi:hypothetical protein
MHLYFLPAFFQPDKKLLCQIGHDDATEVTILHHEFLEEDPSQSPPLQVCTYTSDVLSLTLSEGSESFKRNKLPVLHYD